MTSPPSPPAWQATAPTSCGALNGADPDLPVLLLAHQPKFIDRAAATSASTSSSPATPTAARSGPSTTWSASTSPPSPQFQPPRPPNPPLHQPRHRLLGPAVPRLRPQRDHPARAPLPAPAHLDVTLDGPTHEPGAGHQPKDAASTDDQARHTEDKIRATPGPSTPTSHTWPRFAQVSDASLQRVRRVT